MSEDAAAYYRMRAAKERMLAELSDRPEVAAVHRKLAEDYSAKARAGRPTLKIIT